MSSQCCLTTTNIRTVHRHLPKSADDSLPKLLRREVKCRTMKSKTSNQSGPHNIPTWAAMTLRSLPTSFRPSPHTSVFPSCSPPPPPPHSLVRIGWLGEVEALALVGRQRDSGDMWSQIEQERVETGAEPHRAEYAEADPVHTPQQLLL